MKKLTSKKYWENFYSSDRENGNKSFLRKALSANKSFFLFHYSNYQLWHGLLKQIVPKNNSFRVLEIGSAPGENLLMAYKIFGYQPYGLEYTSEGASINKGKFLENGLDPANIIEADFFSESFLRKFKEKFDVVMSFGFVEHFCEVDEVIEHHISLIKPGGYLIVSIPRLADINYCLANFFNRSSLKVHNLRIMKIEVFSKLFSDKGMIPLFCNHYGVFNFSLFNAESKPKRLILAILKCVQVFLNIVFRIIHKEDLAKNNKLFSPYLLYVGQKQK